jgi:hypothetical protein
MDAHGTHGRGTTAYTPEQYKAVLTLLRVASSRGEYLTVDEVHTATGLLGNTVRAIISAADGTDILLGGTGAKGYKVAATQEEAEEYSYKLSRQLATTARRLHKRAALAKVMWPTP